MTNEAFKHEVINKLVNLCEADGIKLAGYVAKPDYEAGDMDASNRAISEGKPVSKVPTNYTKARTYPGHRGKDATVEEKTEAASGIDPKDWDEKKHGKNLKSVLLEDVLKSVSDAAEVDLTDEELVAFVAKSIKDSIIRAFEVRKSFDDFFDSVMDRVGYPELDEEEFDEVYKSVKEVLKEHLEPKEEKMDEDVQGTSKPKKLDDKAADKAKKERAKKVDSKKKPKKDTKKAIDYGSPADEAAGDAAYDTARDNELTDAHNRKIMERGGRQVGGMSDEAIRRGRTDDEAARNWEKTTFKSFQEAQAWDNPDPSRYFVRPTTFHEKLDLGKRIGYIVDVKPEKPETGAYGNRIVKGAKYNPKKDSTHGNKKLMPKDTVVHDVKNPSSHFDKELGKAKGNPATVLATRHKGPKGEPVVIPPHSHSSDEPGFADSEESQVKLRKDHVAKAVIERVLEGLGDADISIDAASLMKSIREESPNFSNEEDAVNFLSDAVLKYYGGASNPHADEDEEETLPKYGRRHNPDADYDRADEEDMEDSHKSSRYADHPDRDVMSEIKSDKENPVPPEKDVPPPSKEEQREEDEAYERASKKVRQMNARKSDFFTDKVTSREDRYFAYLDAQEKKKRDSEAKSKSESNEAKPPKQPTVNMKSAISEAIVDVLNQPEYATLKADLRSGGPAKPLTRASSEWTSAGEGTDAKGRPRHKKEDETPNIKLDRLMKIQDAQRGHDKEISERDKKAQDYLDRKQKSE